MSQHLYLVGFPLTYSWSPVLQQAAFDYYALPLTYKLLPTAPHELCTVVEKMRQPSTLGFNVTTPYKQDVVALLDSIHPIAQSVGAVNTVVNHSGMLIGFNTDVSGAMRVLQRYADLRNIVIVGAGGAARAVLSAIAHLKLSVDLAVINRGAERLDALGKYLSAINLPAECTLLHEKRAQELLENSSLIINTATDSSALTSFSLTGRVWDLNYGQKSDTLRKYCLESNIPYTDGRELLVYQGADAFELWTGLKAPIDKMMQTMGVCLP